MMNLLKYLFSKKCRINHSKKVLNDYNEISKQIEDIYIEINSNRIIQ